MSGAAWHSATPVMAVVGRRQAIIATCQTLDMKRSEHCVCVCVCACSHGIRAGLVSRGWFENPEHNSPFFDYKWSCE